MSIQEGIELDVTSAVWASGYTLEITFSDGFSRKVDFEPFLKDSVQSEIRKYLDLDAFKGFVINFGNLMWNDYDLCFSIEDLYSGEIVMHGSSSRMVAEGGTPYGSDNKVDK